MDEEAKPKEARLIRPDATTHREVMRTWRQIDSGMDGPRGLLPEQPDNPVAYKLLEAAGEAMGRGEWKGGLTILRLVVKEYRESKEAACARSVIDRLTEISGDKGR